jgi:hypothetical protein
MMGTAFFSSSRVAAQTQSVSFRFAHPWKVTVDTDVSVMAHSWHIRVRLWTFALVRRVADLPF